MFKLWFEDKILPSCVHLLDGIAVVIGPSPTLDGVDQADAFMCLGNTKYDGTRMDRAPNLRVIARLGAGYENIDVPAATERHIPVVYAPDAPTISTSEHTWALIMAVTKKTALANLAMHTTGWGSFWGHDVSKGLELYQSTLGLVGVGRIGSRVAKVALAFGMSVLAYDPFVSPERAAEMNVELAPSLESLLNQADIVSLHLPSTAETRKLMNHERFGQMKRGALFVNAARGALVDESALVDALRSGQVGGAGLDVFDSEPIDLSHPLLKFENVVTTPHIASRTVVGTHRIWETTISQALQVLRGEKPPHLLNPEIWETRRR